LKKSR